MEKYIFILVLMVFLLGGVSAQVSDLGSAKQHECIILPQACGNCTYGNITSVITPESKSEGITEVTMTKFGSYFSYNYCNTSELGLYLVSGVTDVDGENIAFTYDFTVTPSGFDKTIGFYFVLLALSLGIIVLGFTKRDAPIVIMGSFGLYFVGFYIMYYGIDGLKDTIYTQAISLIILGLAAYISIKSGYDLIVD